MPILNCYISDIDYKRLTQISEELERTCDNLTESAIQEAINSYFRGHPDREKDLADSFILSAKEGK